MKVSILHRMVLSINVYYEHFYFIHFKFLHIVFQCVFWIDNLYVFA